MKMAIEYQFSTWVLASLVVYFCYATYSRLTRKDALDALPWVACGQSRWAKFTARFSMESATEALQDAYRKYSMKNNYFMTPSFFSRPKLVIPPSQVEWALGLPDEVLDFKTTAIYSLGLEYTALDPMIVHNLDQHQSIIKGELTRSLGATVEPVLDELSKSMSRLWGADPNWSEQVLWSSMTQVFAQTSNRIFVGSELCRNEDYLVNMVAYAEKLIERAVLIRSLPSWLGPVAGWLLTAPNRKFFAKVFSHLRPIVEKRKADMARGEKAEQPSDLLQWLIQHAYKSGNEHEMLSETICKRLALVNFAAIHTTALTSSNLLLDLLSSNPEYKAIETLKEEIIRVYHESDGKWSKASLAKLVHMDSAIRESMRLHSIGVYGVYRRVIAKDGLNLPNGFHMPQGTEIATLAHFIQRDERLYDHPEEYDPFRFARARAEAISTNTPSADGLDVSDEQRTRDKNSNVLKERNLAAVTTSDKHLAFGIGRHACPGRFFAIQEVKLLLVHALMNYEFKPLSQRPDQIWLRDQTVPSQTVTLTMRKIPSPI